MLFFSLLFFISCDLQDGPEGTGLLEKCSSSVIVNEAIYGALLASNYDIIDTSISGDCLTVTIGASGCDGSSWIVNLVASEKIALSNPPMQNMKLSLNNSELCDAYLKRSFMFDLSPLKQSEEFILVLSGWDSQILYTD